jgi:hypothetical protein
LNCRYRSVDARSMAPWAPAANAKREPTCLNQRNFILSPPWRQRRQRARANPK